MSKVTEILSERAKQLEAQMALLQKELAEIRVALRAIKGEAPERAKPAKRARGKKTIPALILQALGSRPEGLPTAEVVEVLQTDHKRAVTRRNMSWQLSKLKRDKVLIQEGELWKLPT